MSKFNIITDKACLNPFSIRARSQRAVCFFNFKINSLQGGLAGFSLIEKKHPKKQLVYVMFVTKSHLLSSLVINQHYQKINLCTTTF